MSEKPGVTPGQSLKPFTTLDVGGPAELFAEPASRPELLELVEDAVRGGVPYRLLGRGSNVLVPDAGVYGLVIRNTRACNELSIRGSHVYVGASVPLQRLILECAKHDLGGIEYLYSVPGNVGGAVFMNAGRGAMHKRFISDHIVSVEVFDGSRVRTLSRRKCRFAYRESIFQSMQHALILSTVLRLDPQPHEKVLEQVRERSLLVKETQDNSLPNAGTVFKSGFSLRGELKGHSHGGAMFSRKTANWIVNHEGATYEDIRNLLAYAQDLHVERGLRRPIPEWILW